MMLSVNDIAPSSDRNFIHSAGRRHLPAVA
jgi:hypothetical protein